MRKTKTQKGITLVALIITIVVLLILAVVSINSIQNEGIMKQAQNVANMWNASQTNEQGTLGNYEELLNKYGSGSSENVPQVTEGQTVYYDSNNDGEKEEWIVLTAEKGLVEIVSKNVMGSLTLGYNDASVTVTTDLDGDGTVGNNGDKAIASYNNAITTINNYCKSLVTATDNEGVRSVGASVDASGDYSSTNFDSWFKNSETVKVKAGDEYYKTDHERMVGLGIAKSDKSYWLDSRYVKENSSIVSFIVRNVASAGNVGNAALWNVNSSGTVTGNSRSYAVRPVVINPAGI